MPAFYSKTLSDFLTDPTESVIGTLTQATSKAGFSQILKALIESWKAEIEILKTSLKEIYSNSNSDGGHVFLEYPIPRRGKRADAVIIRNGIIAVIEFKVGRDSYDRESILQVEDYALDLRDFHAESAGRVIVPVLVATDAKEQFSPQEDIIDKVKSVWRVDSNNLFHALKLIWETYNTEKMIDAIAWDNSEYRPTPTIIEAASALYAGHNVTEISRSHAGAENLTKTTAAVLDAVNYARDGQKKIVCFITGVPGAGKTLAGLNIVHNPILHKENLGVFLSGNGPLVKVLREALARDNNRSNGVSKRDARNKVSTFIQNVHHFLEEYYGNQKVPIDKVIVFDEAQRAWDEKQEYRKFQRKASEPDMILGIMDRHPSWAALIALIGGGQEIYDGEAGLREWGRALQETYPHWEIFISPELEQGHHSTAGDTLFEVVPENLIIHRSSDLHLSIPVRTYRAEKLAEYIEHVLNGRVDEANITKNYLKEYPVFLTRDLNTAKEWLRKRQRGMRRSGLIASSGERRIKPYGLDVTKELDACSWFLNANDDVRSSCFLEDPATEFSIQGLELDYAGVCWGGDFRRNNSSWKCYRFIGTKWQNVNSAATQKYIMNKYRVLLTRAREGFIIWVPPGDGIDQTRKSEFYDCTADYLRDCGVSEIL